MARRYSDADLAAALAEWLECNRCTISVSIEGDGFNIHYTLQNDIKPQPPIHVEGGKFTIPAGSQQAVINALLGVFFNAK